MVWAKIFIVAVFGGLLVPPAVLAPGRGGPSTETKLPATDVAAGKRLFERHCALCHGIEGKGGRGPALNRVRLAHAPDDAALKTVIEEGIPPNMPEGWFLDEHDVANLAAFVRSLSKIPPEPLPGDVKRGAEVYAKSGCGGCHILNGDGAGFGPELTGIGERHGAEFLRKIITNPSSALPEDFLFVRATTSSNETVEGVRVNEGTFTIQIKDREGNYHSLRKLELKELHKLAGETPMPPFGGILSGTEMQDLVAYLASQRGKS
ncbi:MAG: c-type cytochrome [Candidatus Acidiferrum sp.]